jgi:hypothetical protein
MRLGEMNPLAQAASVAGASFVILVIVAYLSVGVAMSLERLSGELPPGLRLIERMFRTSEEPDAGAGFGSGDILAVVTACLLQLPPLVTIVSPYESVSVPARLVALGFYVAEAAWFAYLRRYLVPKGR